jgi:hypothetical protein
MRSWESSGGGQALWQVQVAVSCRRVMGLREGRWFFSWCLSSSTHRQPATSHQPQSLQTVSGGTATDAPSHATHCFLPPAHACCSCCVEKPGCDGPYITTTHGLAVSATVKSSVKGSSCTTQHPQGCLLGCEHMAWPHAGYSGWQQPSRPDARAVGTVPHCEGGNTTHLQNTPPEMPAVL